MGIQQMFLRGGGGGGGGGTVVSHLRFEGANNSTVFTDDTGRTWTASGAAKISTAWAAEGLSSGYLDGTYNTYVTTPATTDFQFGAGNFKIEFDANPSSDGMFVGNWRGVDANDCAWLVQRSGGKLGFSYGVGGVNAGFLSSASLPGGTGVRCVVERDGTDLRFYIDGVLDSTHALVGALNYYAAEPVSIGAISVVAAAGGSYRYTGYIDNLKITKG